MKAGTIRQRRVVEVNEKLPDITLKQREWAFENVVCHKAVRRKSGYIICLDCAHKWKSIFKHGWIDALDKVECPNCKQSLKIEITRSSVFIDEGYCCVLDKCKEFQVIRKFYVKANFKANKPRETFWYEVSRIYIDEKGNHEIIGYTCTNGWHGESWTHDFVLKCPKTLKNHDFSLKYGYYPYKKIIPKLKRNGFNGKDFQFPLASLFKGLLSNQKVETLYKLKRLDFLEYYLLESRGKYIDTYWQQIKLAIKRGYHFKDLGIWFDYLRLLERFGKDTMSPRYIFPKSIKKEHDKYVERVRKINRKEELMKMKAHIKEEQKVYIKQKKRFFKLAFVKDNMAIEPIKSVEQLMVESDMLRHCAYGSSYHKRNDSLMLSARVDNKPIETIQISLGNFQISQARGFNNKPSKYHNDIVALINENMKQIKKASVIKKKSNLKIAV